MSRFVLDCSITMAWCFEEERSSAAQAVLDAMEPDGALVPSIWPLEVANVLAVAEQRGRFHSRDIASFLERLSALPIIIDDQTARRALGDVLDLARAHGLTAYDAAYLELALREGTPLATLDSRLQATATELGIELIVGP